MCATWIYLAFAIFEDSFISRQFDIVFPDIAKRSRNAWAFCISETMGVETRMNRCQQGPRFVIPIPEGVRGEIKHYFYEKVFSIGNLCSIKHDECNGTRCDLS